MIVANKNIFEFYRITIEFFCKFLSEKYTEYTLENLYKFKTIIVQKITKMLNTLVVVEANDKISARCIMRSILDSVSIYCFIYENNVEEEMMFRHYLYTLDGFVSYKSVINIMEGGDEISKYNNRIIEEIEGAINNHSYVKTCKSDYGRKKLASIIDHRYWNYINIESTDKYSYKTLYEKAKFDSSLSRYYSEFYAQFSHGLFFSNMIQFEANKNILFEIIPAMDRFLGAIFKTFPIDKEEIINEFSISCKNIITSVNSEKLLEFGKELKKQNKCLLI